MTQTPGPSARIRLNRETASILADLLRDYLAAEWDVRAQIKRNGQPATVMNKRIDITKKLIGEVQRAREEMGWLTNEEQQKMERTMSRTSISSGSTPSRTE